MARTCSGGEDDARNQDDEACQRRGHIARTCEHDQRARKGEKKDEKRNKNVGGKDEEPEEGR